MEIIIGTIVFLFLLLAVGIVISVRFREKKNEVEKPEKQKEVPSDCCGAHEVCDVDELIQKSTEIVYFEDEDLDQYSEIVESEYTDNQIEEFREILYTLQSYEITAWIKSLELRTINLPAILKQESRQLISEHISNRIAS
ncbi:MAG: hypothetical protein HQ522_23145 [Bacteroidetes bacterium]|nr:hypothetical protein [Bacteroidota bacterium]